MVEIHFDALGEGKLGKSFVVVILFENDDVFFGECFDDAAGDGCLAGAGAPADPDNQWPRVQWSNRALLDYFFSRFFSSITAWAAARRAMGTQNGVALT